MGTVARRAVVALIVGALLLAACGGDDSEGGTDVSSPEPTEELGSKPDFEVASDEAPPGQLVVEDLVEGQGERAVPGDTLVVHYVGKAWSTGQQFDASWDRGAPFTFELGAGGVIQGWEQGMEGMRVGGRRKLVIPPELGYGERGAGEAIGPNETLVFVVDLVEISSE